MSKLISRFIYGFIALGFSQTVTAASIGLTPVFPDLVNFGASYNYSYTDMCFAAGASSGPTQACGTTSGNGQNKITYSALDEASSSGTLTVSGGAMALNPDGSGNIGVSGGSYSLVANFTGGGVFAGGTVSAAGITTNPDFQSGSLVTGDLFNFGFSGIDQAGSIEFEFDNVGGDMAIFGNLGGVIISLTDMLAGNGSFTPFSGAWDPLLDNNPAFWQRDFSGSANVDTFVPVPAAIWLFGSGLLGLFSLARVKRTA